MTRSPDCSRSGAGLITATVSRRFERCFPKVLANFAITCDGKVSTGKRTPSNFTSKGDKRRLQEIRALGDALLAGRNTVASDAMSMGLSSSELREKREAKGKSPSPLRVIVSNRGRFDPAWKVFSNAGSPLILCTASPIPDRVAGRFPPFVRILEFPGGKIPIKGLLQQLHARWGVRSLVCEGGPSLFASLLEADVLDELYLTISPLVFGGREAPSLTGLPLGFLAQERRFRLKSLEPCGNEVFLHYVRDRGKSPTSHD